MTRLLGLAVVAALALATPVWAQPAGQAVSIRIAFFSPARAFAESSVGKAATAKLGAAEAEKAKAVEEKNTALQSIERALELGASVMSEALRSERTRALEKFRLDTERFIQDAQADLMGMQRDAESAFLVRLRPVIDRVVKVNGIQLLFNADRGVLPWSDPALDVTAEVIKQLDGGVQ